MRHEFYYEFVDTQNSVDGLLVWISILKSFVIDKEVKNSNFAVRLVISVYLIEIIIIWFFWYFTLSLLGMTITIW